MKAGEFPDGSRVLCAKIDMASPNINLRDPVLYRIGWNDPRMPMLSGLRRRGYTPVSIRNFCEKIGVAKTNSIVDFALLEHCIREDLNSTAPRVMGVLRPLKVVIENYPENQEEWFDIENNPEKPEMGSRRVPFSRVLYIEQDDFMENPPNKFFRLAPGHEVRLKSAYFIKCENVVKDEKTGEILELRCTYDPATKGGNVPDGRKVKGTIHWVSAAHAVDAEVRLYDHLFAVPDPDNVGEGGDYKTNLNPRSLEILKNCKLEPGLAKADTGSRYQFLRLGYFCADSVDSKEDAPVFNRIVGLKDFWAKEAVKA